MHFLKTFKSGTPQKLKKLWPLVAKVKISGSDVGQSFGQEDDSDAWCIAML